MGACCSSDPNVIATATHSKKNGRIHQHQRTVEIKGDINDFFSRIDYSVFVANLSEDEDMRQMRAQKEALLWQPAETKSISIAEMPAMSFFINLLLAEEVRRGKYRELLIRNSTIAEAERDLRFRLQIERMMIKNAKIAPKVNGVLHTKCLSCGGFHMKTNNKVSLQEEHWDRVAAILLSRFLLSEPLVDIQTKVLRSIDNMPFCQTSYPHSASSRAPRHSSTHWNSSSNNNSFLPKASASQTTSNHVINSNAPTDTNRIGMEGAQNSNNFNPTPMFLPEPTPVWRTPSMAPLREEREPSWNSLVVSTPLPVPAVTSRMATRQRNGGDMFAYCTLGAFSIIEAATAACSTSMTNGEPKRKTIKGVLKAVRAVLSNLGHNSSNIEEDLIEEVPQNAMRWISDFKVDGPPVITMTGTNDLGSGVLAVSTGDTFQYEGDKARGGEAHDTNSTNGIVNSLTNGANGAFGNNMPQTPNASPEDKRRPLVPTGNTFPIGPSLLKQVAQVRTRHLSQSLAVGIFPPSLSFCIPLPPIPQHSGAGTQKGIKETKRHGANVISPHSPPTTAAPRNARGRYGKESSVGGLTSLLNLTAAATTGGSSKVGPATPNTTSSLPSSYNHNGAVNTPAVTLRLPLALSPKEMLTALPPRRLVDRIPNNTPSHHNSCLLLPAKGFAIGSYRHPLAPTAALLLAPSAPIPAPFPTEVNKETGEVLAGSLANNNAADKRLANTSQPQHQSNVNLGLVVRLLKGLPVVGRYGIGGKQRHTLLRRGKAAKSPTGGVAKRLPSEDNSTTMNNNEPKATGGGSLGVISPIGIVPPTFPSPLASVSTASVQPSATARKDYSSEKVINTNQQKKPYKTVQWRDLNGLGLRVTSANRSAAPPSILKYSVSSKIGESLIKDTIVVPIVAQPTHNTGDIIPSSQPLTRDRSIPSYIDGEANADKSGMDSPSKSILDEWEADVAEDALHTASFERKLKKFRDEKAKKKKKGKAKKSIIETGIPPNHEGALRPSDLPTTILTEDLIDLPRQQRLLHLHHLSHPKANEGSQLVAGTSKTISHQPSISYAEPQGNATSRGDETNNSQNIFSYLPPLDAEDLFGVSTFDTLWLTLQAMNM